MQLKLALICSVLVSMPYLASGFMEVRIEDQAFLSSRGSDFDLDHYIRNRRAASKKGAGQAGWSPTTGFNQLESEAQEKPPSKNEIVTIISEVAVPEIDGEGPQGSQNPPKDLQRKINRHPYQEKIDPNEPEGCGRPICTLIDARTWRFSSMCKLVQHMENGLFFRILHIQKGDCADAIDGNLHDAEWGTVPRDCSACSQNEVCNKTVCIAMNGLAKTYDNICEFYKDKGKASDVVTAHIGLGSCSQLFNDDVHLFTEWFDIDEPCLAGDTENAKQNLMWVLNFNETAAFRFCAKKNRGFPEFLTTMNLEVTKEKNVDYSTDEEFITCTNKAELPPPPPPHYWFHKKVKCRDYKMRHKCRCLYGCNEMNNRARDDNAIKIVTPSVTTLFDECEWKPFLDTTTPDNGTWDAEDRGTIVRTPALRNHVCGSSVVDSMYIDVRTVDDDTPWHETDSKFTKITPTFGTLCLNKNNEMFGTRCKDFKVRFCCKKNPPAQWGDWTPWSECTKTCDSGTQRRSRDCPVKTGQETCNGNYKGGKYSIFKEEVRNCNQKECPTDYKFSEWSSWETCTVTCGGGKTVRKRTCTDSSNPGSEPCPKKRENRELYIETKDCNPCPCPDPEWTAWTDAPCSVTCGVGRKILTRECVDSWTDEPIEQGTPLALECHGEWTRFVKCEEKYCPVAGGLTEWGPWQECNVDCGEGGKQIRRRYCANPIPQNGGADCEGPFEEYRECVDVVPCPVNCEYTEWGPWNTCSVTCGNPGEGRQSRYRNVAQEAAFGGKPCRGEKSNTIICYHVDHAEVKNMSEKSRADKKMINYCPVDCVWAEWEVWNERMCPGCIKKGLTRERVITTQKVRSRMPKDNNYYGLWGGQDCHDKDGEEKAPCYSPEKLKDPNQPPKCDDPLMYAGFWSEWGDCQGPCGKRGVRIRKSFIYNSEGRMVKVAKTEEMKCDSFCPPVGWSDWTSWTHCPVSCGNAQVLRKRSCQNSNKANAKEDKFAFCGGKDLEEQREDCNAGPCPESESNNPGQDSNPMPYVGREPPYLKPQDMETRLPFDDLEDPYMKNKMLRQQ